MKFYWFLLGMLAVWRVTHLFQAEDGPFKMFHYMRLLMGKLYLNGLASCFYCFSIWIALPAAAYIGDSWPERGLLWPAFSGAAILLERVTYKQPIAYFEQEENE